MRLPFTWEVDISDFNGALVAVMYLLQIQLLMPPEEFTASHELRREARKPEFAAPYIRDCRTRSSSFRDDPVSIVV